MVLWGKFGYKSHLLPWRPDRVLSLSFGRRSLGACTMVFGSGDYLYCSHSTCRRRFCSESALAKHYGSFHGRPTCDTCGKKLKKSGQVSLLSLSLSTPLVQPNQPHPLRPQHTCMLLDASAFLEDYPALDFVSNSTDPDYSYDTENTEVRITLSNDTYNTLITSTCR